HFDGRRRQERGPGSGQGGRFQFVVVSPVEFVVLEQLVRPVVLFLVQFVLVRQRRPAPAGVTTSSRSRDGPGDTEPAAFDNGGPVPVPLGRPDRGGVAGRPAAPGHPVGGVQNCLGFVA